MTTKTLTNDVRTIRALATAALALTMLAGCTKQDKDILPGEVKAVEAYGLKLDESATPQQVTWALLQSLAQDVKAAQAHDHEKQKAANRISFALAAPTVIEQRLTSSMNRALPEAKADGLGTDRDKKIFDFVHYWAPIVAHYIDSFDADPATAVTKMRLITSSDGQTAHVFYDVVHDPAETDPAKQQAVTLDIELTVEKVGATSYWRVARIGYLGPNAKTTTRPASKPAA